ncbi:non-ribosomal peptide synthetase [Hyalangium versicolor]|uniref:non-ribosomal peptide synthetase n=1 Tax=Hyalangium versicolor TaxID=2861190 RepID=UPI001CCFFB76|nr:non-ribosomal peptide synthetase [Hyalangium versicolor]
MTARGLLGQLTSKGVRLWASEGQLRFKAVGGVLTAEDKEALRTHKAELLPLLEGRTATGLSGAQRRLWFLTRLAPDQNAYLVSQAFTLRGPLQPELLERALQQVVDRQESLRATFSEQEGHLVQFFAARQVLPLRRVRLEGPVTEERVQQALRGALSGPFDFEREPPVRTCLLELGPEHYIWGIGLHHLVADGWSLGLLNSELEALYRAGLEGGTAALPELKLGYADFVDWEREVHRASAGLDYWRKRLEHLPSMELPGDFPRPPITHYRGRQHLFTLPPEVDTALARAAEQVGATPFAALFAVLMVTLQRYCRQRDVVVGTPHANRGDRGLEPLIGCMVNTLVVRTEVSPGISFAELVRNVHRSSLDAFEHQGVAFEQLVQLAGQRRDPSRSPLFQMFFGMQNASRPLRLSGVECTEYPFDSQLCQFDLECHLTPSPTGTRGMLLTSASLFSEEFGPRFSEAFTTLATRLSAAPDAPVDAAGLLNEARAREVLAGWNQTQEPWPRERCLHEWVRGEATRAPDAPAVTYAGRTLSRAELMARAHGIAQELSSRGIGPGHFVGVLGQRSSELLAAVLGVLGAGAAYLPLDPDLPEDRIRFMLEDSQARLVLAEEAAPNAVPAGIPVLTLRELEPLRADNPPRVELTSEAPAYLLYTSGSTGRPKGVVVRHRNVVSCLWALARKPGLGTEDVLLAVTTWSFDISVLELFLPLVTGARLVIAETDAVRDGERLARLLLEQGVTAMQGTPSTWSLLKAWGWPGSKRFKALCGGEHPSRELVDWLASRCAELWNLYGPTETTIWSLRERLLPGAPILAGLPLENTQLFVLDGSGLPVSPGVPGELYIGGEGVALGYWNRPELTAERFVSINPGGVLPTPLRCYRTGDLVRQRGDGRVEFLGRLDDQVKVRGYRIETGEIEHVLRQHPKIGEVAVVARAGADGEKELIACLCPAPGADPKVQELRSWLKGRLPAYMVPAHFVLLAELPRTHNGKVHRQALPPASHSLLPTETAYEAPVGPMEETVASLFADLLPGRRPGRGDDFFSLGGHSLMAARLLYAVRERLGVTVPMSELFVHPTVKGLAGALKFARLKAAAGSGDANALEAAVAELSEDEAQSMLSRLVSTQEVSP